MYLYIVLEYLIALIKQCSNKSCTSPTPMPRPHDISNSSVIVCSRLCFTQNIIICNLILSLIEVEHIDTVARFSYCITGILIYSPMHIKKLVYLIIILTNKS